MWVDNDVPTLKNPTGLHFQNGHHNTAQIKKSRPTDPNFEDHAIGNTHFFFWPYQI
jgi:hypothetical protein